MRTVAMATGVVLLSSMAIRAQQAGTFRSAVDLVPVFTTVIGPDGSFAGGLTKEDFTVLDNGKPQEIVSFSDQAQAISVSLILDTSSSWPARCRGCSRRRRSSSTICGPTIAR